MSSARKPRFQVGDRVRVVWPPHRQMNPPASGEVTEVIGSSSQTVYRYRVTFPDGTAETFFGFELEIES